MQYLTRAVVLAEQRGYLRYPDVIALEAAVPEAMVYTAALDRQRGGCGRCGASGPSPP